MEPNYFVVLVLRNVWNRYHYLLMMCIIVRDTTIFHIKGSIYCYVNSQIIKSKVISLLQNIVLTKINRTLQGIKSLLFMYKNR